MVRKFPLYVISDQPHAISSGYLDCKFLSSLAQDKRVTIGFTNPTGTAALPYVMAEKKGFFKKEG